MINLATVQTTLQMFDGMTPALRSLTGSMNMIISSFETMQRASSNSIDIRDIQAARAELNKAEITFNDIEREIREADQAQQKFNNDIRNGQGAASGLLLGFRNLMATTGATLGIKGIIEMSDEMALTASRLDLMNDGLQSTVELQEKIFESAQRARSPYLDTAKVVSKLGILAGDAFSSSKEIVNFAEQMNKQFKIGGSSLIEQTAAMYQLTQAMAAGKLQGDEFRSIRENAPLLAKSIEDYMTNAGVEGTMKDWSADGLITADVIKNAMFSMADEVNERFEKLPMTWGQVWTTTVNNILRYSQPLLDFINLLANNWEMVAPVLLVVADALIAYAIAAYGAAAADKALTLAKIFALPIYSLLTGATMIETAAQWGLNTALYACPIIWIIAGVVALIAIIYLAVAAVNKFAGTSYSATGMIAGAFAWAGAFIANIFIASFNLIMDIAAVIVNYLLNFAEFFANFLNDPVGSVVRLFAGMVDTILSMLQSVASTLDTIFGSNLASSVEKWKSGLSNKVVDLVGEAKVKVERFDPNALHLDRYDLTDAYKAGYKWGEGIEDRFNFSTGVNDYTSLLDDIAANTGKTADALEISEEDLKYMRDLAEREVIDRTVLRDVKVTLSNSFGDIRETADVDGIIDKMTERLAQAIANEAEGSFSV